MKQLWSPYSNHGHHRLQESNSFKAGASKTRTKKITECNAELQKNHNFMHWGGIRNISQINARSHVGQMLVDGDSTSSRILAHAVQNAKLLPWNVTNGFDENGCIGWYDKFEGIDTSCASALCSWAWNASFQRKAIWPLWSVPACSSWVSSAEGEEAFEYDVTGRTRVRITASSSGNARLRWIISPSTMGWLGDGATEKTFCETFLIFRRAYRLLFCDELVGEEIIVWILEQKIWYG